MNKLLLIITLFTATLGWGQYEIISIERNNDNFCNTDYKDYIIKIKHISLGIPSLATSVTNSNQGKLSIYQYDSFTNNDTTELSIDVSDLDLLNPGDLVDDSLFFQFVDAGTPIPLLDTIVPVTVNGEIDATFNIPNEVLCINGQPFDLNNYATLPGGSYNIYDYGSTNIFNPNEFYLSTEFNSFSFNYNVTIASGCTSNSDQNFSLIDPSIVTISTNPSNCGSAIGSITAGITGTGPYDIYWSTGFSESAVSTPTVLSNLSSGVYYANITDANGCKAVGTALVGDADITVTSIIDTTTCAGMNDGTIDLTISGTGGNVTETFWSNGATTEDMTGHAGEYSVEIHTDNNCNAFGTYIIPEKEIEFSLATGSATYATCGNADGGADVNITGGTGTLAIVWTDTLGNVIPTVTEDLTAVTTGVYTCTITDDNGCSADWDIVVPSINNLGIDIDLITKSDCGMANGGVEVTLFDFGGGPAILTWTDKNNQFVSSDEDLTNVPAGDYTLEFENTSGCSNFIAVTVPVVRPYQPQICLLTVDTSLIYNQIVWEKDPNNIVDGFNIYRETTKYGEFEKITSLTYDQESTYIDNAASPVNRSWRYFITTYDGCSESYGSFIHKTIHIVEVTNNGTTVDLAWDDYEGITFSSIDLMRYDDVNEWQTIATLSSGTNSYTDTPTEFSGLDYMISFNLASPCTSTKAQDHNASRSNKSSSVFSPGGPTDLSVTEKEGGKIVLYPNPTSNNLNIYIENYEDYNTITIVNVNGKIVYNDTVNNSLNSINTEQFTQGMYFVQIISDSGIVTEKILKE